VTEENKTAVSIYLPDDRFYDFYDYSVVEGKGVEIDLTDIAYTDILLHFRGGSIILMGNQPAYTTTEVRKQPFHLLIAPDRHGKASGSLHLDDGDSIEQPATSEIEFEYADDELKVSGSFGYTAGGDKISAVTVLGRTEVAAASKWKRGAEGWQRFEARDVEYEAKNGAVLCASIVRLVKSLG
jgi:alpha-glucosidase